MMIMVRPTQWKHRVVAQEDEAELDILRCYSRDQQELTITGKPVTRREWPKLITESLPVTFHMARLAVCRRNRTIRASRHAPEM